MEGNVVKSGAKDRQYLSIYCTCTVCIVCTVYNTLYKGDRQTDRHVTITSTMWTRWSHLLLEGQSSIER